MKKLMQMLFCNKGIHLIELLVYHKDSEEYYCKWCNKRFNYLKK